MGIPCRDVPFISQSGIVIELGVPFDKTRCFEEINLPAKAFRV